MRKYEDVRTGDGILAVLPHRPMDVLLLRGI